MIIAVEKKIADAVIERREPSETPQSRWPDVQPFAYCIKTKGQPLSLILLLLTKRRPDERETPVPSHPFQLLAQPTPKSSSQIFH